MSESKPQKSRRASRMRSRRAGRDWSDGCLTAARLSERISRMTSRPMRSGLQGSSRRVVRVC